MKKDLLYAYIALGAICLIWGTTYLAIRIGVQYFPPLLFVVIRQLLSGLVLGILAMVFTKAQWPSFENIKRQAIAGFFMITLGNGLVSYAEVNIPSGVAAILCSLMPVTTIMINLFLNKEEKPNPLIIFGVLVGLTGIVMIFREHLTEFSRPEYLVGILIILIGVVAWAGGSVWLKKTNSEGNLFLNTALQMFFGGIWTIPGVLLFDDLSKVHFSTESFFALIYLIVFGSVIAYACYSYALRKLPMTILSLYAYVNPVVAVILGWLILDEKLNLMIGFSILTTVAGIYVVNRGYAISKAWKTQSLAK
ncbi:MAG: EamA family transporter [Chryseolinea sp.]